jgi:hypothetical protein
MTVTSDRTYRSCDEAVKATPSAPRRTSVLGRRRHDRRSRRDRTRPRLPTRKPNRLTESDGCRGSRRPEWCREPRGHAETPEAISSAARLWMLRRNGAAGRGSGDPASVGRLTPAAVPRPVEPSGLPGNRPARCAGGMRRRRPAIRYRRCRVLTRHCRVGRGRGADVPRRSAPDARAGCPVPTARAETVRGQPGRC